MTPDATAVVTAVRAVLTTQLAWQGTATELLHALAAADGTLALPGNARAMAAHLRGVAPSEIFRSGAFQYLRTIAPLVFSSVLKQSSHSSTICPLTLAKPWAVRPNRGSAMPLSVCRTRSKHRG
jgi:hypothetical protein